MDDSTSGEGRPFVEVGFIVDLDSLYARFEGRMNGFSQGGEALGALFAGLLYAYAPLLPFFLQVAIWVLAFSVVRTMKALAASSIGQYEQSVRALTSTPLSMSSTAISL